MVTKTHLCWVQSHHGWEWLEIYIWSTGPNPWYEMVLYLRRPTFVVKNFGWLRQFSSFSTENGDGHIQISQRWPIEISLYISLKSFSDLRTQKYVGVPVWRSHGRQRGRGFTTFQKLLLLQALKYFAILFDHISIDHNNLVFLTPTSSHQPMSPPPPIKFNIQVLIRLNMGEDVNQKHYPRFVLSETYLSFYKIER